MSGRVAPGGQSGSGADAKAVTRAANAGEIRKIRDGLYTSQPEEAWPDLTKRNARDIVAALFPGAVASWRSSSLFGSGGPVEGVFFLSYKYNKTIHLPGLVLRFTKGAGPVAGDSPWKDGRLHIAGQERAFLENLSISRAVPRRAAGDKEVRARLNQMLGAKGEEALNIIRDRARVIAPELGLDREMKLLDEMISRLLVTHPSTKRSAAPGKPVDDRRLQLFEVMVDYLVHAAPAEKPSAALSERANRNLAFIESYFSNFIEGTRFDVAEAVDIAISGHWPAARPKDAHDILGVMAAAQNPLVRASALSTGPAILTHLSALHREVFRNRPEFAPGEFKEKPNRAGATEFAHPSLTQGTLVELSHRLPLVPEGIARAVLIMFGVSEVHPFNDGNGRIARLAMNAELSRCGLQRIVIPTLARDEYLDCLRAMSRGGDPKAITDMLAKMHAWSASFDYQDLDALIEKMKLTNAFEEDLRNCKLLTAQSAAVRT